MARIEYVNTVRTSCTVDLDDGVRSRHSEDHALSTLPLLFWDNGVPWAEVNHFALHKARAGGVKFRTARNLIGHIYKYACWLEERQMDWRHFDMSKSDGVYTKFIRDLFGAVNRGEITSSTATTRLRTVINFYRYCELHKFIHHSATKGFSNGSTRVHKLHSPSRSRS